MKKNKFLVPSNRNWKKLLLTMKLCLLFLLISATSLMASSGYSQNTTLSIHLKNATLRDLIREVERQSEFIFVFYDEVVDLDRQVDVQVDNQTVDKILDKIFKSSELTYRIFDRQIGIGKRDPVTGIIELPKPLEELMVADKKLTGLVKDTKGEPIPGATVIVKGTTTGTVTDADGNFVLHVPPDARILSVSFVGFKTQEILIGNRITFTVSLEEMIVGLEEIVAVGYGTQKKATITGAISSIKNAELLQSPQANISNALAGRLSGILSVQRSGEPGSDQSTIRIRGIGTFTGVQDPLIMVDGIETDNYNNIDPNEIENIAILKDASATAVYGVRGANGVILITTRRGSEGRPVVSYSVQQAFSRLTEMQHSMNAYDYANSFNLARKNDSYVTGGYTPAYSDEAIAKYKSHEDPVFYPDVDWFPYMFDKTAGQIQHNLNISGGTDKVRCFVSLGYFNQEGVINHTDLVKDFDAQIIYKRYNIRTNFDFDITKRLTSSISFSSQIENRSGSAVGAPMIFMSCWASNPVDHPLLEDTGGKFVNLDGALSSASANPIGYLFQNGYQKDYRNYLNSSIRFNYDLDFVTKGLSARLAASYNNYNNQYIRYSKTFVTYRAIRLEDQTIVYIPQRDPNPFGFNETFDKNRKVYLEAGFDYARKFGDHNLGGLLLYNQSKRHDPDLAYLVPNGYQGIVGRVTYDYKTRYLAEVNIGYNGTENFAPGKRFGFFPAYSLGWVASDEPFFPKNDYLTYLKIRGSYGVVGNDKIGGDRFLYRPTSYSYFKDNATGSTNFYHFGEDGSNLQGYQGSLEGALGNPDLTWERAKKFNIGAEVIFLKDRLKVAFDWFDENRDNILATKSTVPWIVAATFPAYNMGKMSNSGHEIEVYYNDNIGNFNYWIKGNYTFAHNVVEYKDEIAHTYPYQYQTGHRYGQLFGKLADGFFNTWEEVNDPNRPVYGYVNNRIQPGDIRYIDVNGDGRINGDDSVPVGYSNFPEKIFGVSFGGSFKGFDFSVLFQGAGNVSVDYLNSTVTVPFSGGRNAYDFLIESWSQERYEKGLPIRFPRFTENGSTTSPNLYTSFWIADASYLRLKNAEIGYTFPTSFLKKYGVSYLRLYANGNNLLTWDSLLPGLDPESAAAITWSENPYPVARTINLGLNIKF
jgi:TonB-linked SusC/RagA family outer membrane protein